jgi:uncharacterized protein
MGTGQRNRQIETSNIAQGIHIVAKPTGPACNLNCAYCFYLEKKALFGAGGKFRMTDEILSVFIKKYIHSQPTPLVEFVWQGGEPTLLGLDFFKRVVELQRPFARRKMIRNSLQTNGTLLTRKWCEFLKKYNFMVGISLDGPKEIHDRYRRDRRGNGTFDRVMQGLKLLQKYRIEYNVMACIARDTAKQPLDIYRFFRNEGVEFIQFTPVVERMPDEPSLSHGLRLAGPASLDKQERQTQVTPWTVLPEEYGDFLIAVYEEWIRQDVGKVFVMNFEWALNTWIGNPSPVCIHAEQCGWSVVLEHNGDVYACDHCVYPEYKLGNIVTDPLPDLVTKSLQSGFGIIKDHALPRQCRECDVLAACRGGCPKHRFAKAYDDEPGLQYLCEGYKKFFLHIRKYLNVITQLLEKGLPASFVMEALKGPLVIKLGQPESSNPTKNKIVLH